MEVGVAVDGSLPLVVHHILARASLLLIIVVLKKEKLQKDAEEKRWTEKSARSNPVPELVLHLRHAVVDDMHHFCAYICQETAAILQ